MERGHEVKRAVKYRMGHGEGTDTFERHYQGEITAEDIKFFENHHAPDFTYDPTHAKREALQKDKRIELGKLAHAGYAKKYSEDPDFKAATIVAQVGGRQRDPVTGKCIVPEASLANLELRPGITPQCREAAFAAMAKLEEADVDYRRKVVAKSMETRRRNGGGKIVASPGSIEALRKAAAKRKAARAAGIGKMGYLGVPFTAVPKENERRCFAPPIFI